MMRVLVTGANGFVGRQLCRLLTHRGYTVRAALRMDRGPVQDAAEHALVGEIGSATEWAAALAGVDCVVHGAARAHVMDDLPAESHLYMESNANGTARLAEASAAAGIRRLIYLSSVKVNGERSVAAPFSRDDSPNPSDAYAVSKWIGETRLREIASRSDMETATVRSPLVYGPEVRANFLRLMRLVDRQIPLPLGRIANARSLVSVWNLCDLIERLIRGSIPAQAVYMVSDGTDLSTPDLVRRIGAAMGRRVALLSIPVGVLRALANLTRKQAEFDRLCGTLTVDISATCRDLSWTPPVSVEEGIARTVDWYLTDGPGATRDR
jgi:nucleoside-diphosphate-sugar epimerase